MHGDRWSQSFLLTQILVSHSLEMVRWRSVILAFAFTLMFFTCPEHVETFMVNFMWLALALSVSAALNAGRTSVRFTKAADATPTYVCQRWNATEVHV